MVKTLPLISTGLIYYRKILTLILLEYHISIYRHRLNCVPVLTSIFTVPNVSVDRVFHFHSNLLSIDCCLFYKIVFVILQLTWHQKWIFKALNL